VNVFQNTMRKSRPLRTKPRHRLINRRRDFLIYICYEGNDDNILSKGKRLLGKPRRRWKDIRMDPGKIGREGAN
jgi:hypothetical protein